ncbi:uncharacterized protein DSM5745_08235 [Aspergillus mulundensis]|uniref:gamma-glutamylcyclotransferase n=1 Tax=Aspergillus mulundensis TaxID=1810919 RepID=A0A3D8RA34_9EURO|nr:Uncharacterized protein DSM5745_08235 [Aspergillus mulundensis]RDW70724.1 Uncharacterized protein DSM5745_08235 [Aspergillus mulundensis]
MQNDQFENQRLEGAQDASFMTLSQSYTLEQTKEDLLPCGQKDIFTSRGVPETTPIRQQASISARSVDQDEYLPGRVCAGDSSLSAQNTVLYLAYGSNLASKTFLGMRGIKPLSQLNVIVPDLRLTFDLPGIPYIEPCFAGTHFRDIPAAEDEENDVPDFLEKHTLLQRSESDQDRYKGPLIGVVYEVTLSDYAKIIATEGGGRGYKDIVVTCQPFPNDYNPADPIPERPATQPLKAHTLLSPAGMQEMQLRTKSKLGVPRNRRYTQPSARYLNLITTGAEEHNLPLEYRAYLAQIQPYRISSVRQRIGMVFFLVLWGPWLLLILGLSRFCARPDGRSPEWVGGLSDSVKAGIWISYDKVFVHIFGNGERTVKR